MEDKENSEKYNSDSDSSDSGSASPVDDLSKDPNYKSRVKSVEPRTVSTRRHIVLDNNKSDLKYKSKAIQNLHLHSEDSAISKTPTEFTPSSYPIDSAHLTSAISGAVGGSKPQKGNMSDDDFKEAFLDMAQSFKAIGQTAKQNNTQFLADIPYFGVPPSTYKNKSIIPLSEPNRFLDLVDTITSTADFTEAGKVSVLKSKLLGPALEHWSTYTGGKLEQC